MKSLRSRGLLLFLGIALFSTLQSVFCLDFLTDKIEANTELLKVFGAAMHVPYVLTIDSTDPRLIQIAGVLAALPTGSKVTHKIFEKQNDRFFKIVLWDLPKFLLYFSAFAYDIVNVLNPGHMVLERQDKGAELKRLKYEQGVALAMELLLRVFACVIHYKAEVVKVGSSFGRDLDRIAQVSSGCADLVELLRLLSRFRTYSAVPGLDVDFHFEVKHLGAGGRENQEKNRDLIGTSSVIVPVGAVAQN